MKVRFFNPLLRHGRTHNVVETKSVLRTLPHVLRPLCSPEPGGLNPDSLQIPGSEYSLFHGLLILTQVVFLQRMGS